MLIDLYFNDFGCFKNQVGTPLNNLRTTYALNDHSVLSSRCKLFKIKEKLYSKLEEVEGAYRRLSCDQNNGSITFTRKEALRVLGLTDPTDEEIRRAYRSKALKEHPDKGGEADLFCLYTKARDVLLGSP